jgi:hypothetical protein
MSSAAVKLKTPIPTLEQVGKELGLSKTRQNRLLSIVRRDSSSGQFTSSKRNSSRSLSTTKRAKN